ncbi:hypothetical protein CS8_096240 [Cupriavidus sp. 8B]
MHGNAAIALTGNSYGKSDKFASLGVLPPSLDSSIAQGAISARRLHSTPGLCQLDYLGRYTHRVAICNHRLQRFDGDAVTFHWKDYKHGAASRTMTLAADEFIRRFLLHTPPSGFKHIRSYGLLANRHRAAKLATCRRLLGVVAPVEDTFNVMDDYRDRYQRLTGRSLHDCPVCARGHMVCIETFSRGALPRAPPPHDVH